MHWTLLRSGFFYQNFAGMLGAGLRAGTVRFPDLAVPAVDPRDMGRVAAAILSDAHPEAHHGQAYDISGPAMLQIRDVVPALAAVAGRTVEYVPVPVTALASFLPPFLVELLVYMEEKGAAAVPLSDATMRIAGVHTPFASWLQEHAALFK